MMNANNVISIISYTLSIGFPNHEIYKEVVSQDMETPSFFIQLINSDHDKLLNNRYQQQFKVAIKYFTDKIDDTYQDMYSVGDELTEILEIMEYSNKIIKGKNMEYKVIEGVLHFSIDIENRVIKKVERNKFGPLEVEINGY